MKATVALILVMVAALGSACTDQPTASRTGQRDGMAVRGSLSATLTAFSPAGTFDRQIAKEPFRTVIRGGIGSTRALEVGEGASPRLHLTVAANDALDGLEPQSKRTSAIDAEGRVHVLESVRIGRRPQALRHYVNGVLRATIIHQWRSEDGIWVLASAQLTMLGESGETVGRLNLSTRDVQLAEPNRIAAGARRLTRLAGSLVLPRPLSAQISCERYATRMGAALALGVVACGTLNGLACAGAMLAYWAAYDSAEAAGCL